MRCTSFALLLLAVLGSSGLAASEILERRFPPEGRFTDGFITHGALGLGWRIFSDSEWEGLQQVPAVEVLYDTRPITWPISIAGSISGAFGSVDSDDGREFDLQVYDFHLGVRHGYRFDAIEVFYGLGLSGSSVKIETSSFGESDLLIGGYGQLGGQYILRDRWVFGLAGRYQLTERTDFDIAAERPTLSGITTIIFAGGRF